MRILSPLGTTGCVAALALASVGCEDLKSATELNPTGPPMIRQVFVTEKVTTTTDTGGTVTRTLPQIAFGTHADFPEDDGKVENALASDNQKIRIVIDELLVGNHLEELACNSVPASCERLSEEESSAIPECDGYSRVPVGATPDDIRNCSGPVETQTNCEGKFAVCIGPEGERLGILDANEDGASDNLRMIEGVVKLRCAGVDIPLDQEQSFWNPSGNQQVPAQQGVNGIGPAIIIVPEIGLRTGAECQFELSPNVVDKDGNRVCAPPLGDVTQNCVGDGDISNVTFNVEGLRVTGSDPRDGDGNVRLTMSNASPDALLLVQFNAGVELDSFISNFQLIQSPGEAGGGEVMIPATKFDQSLEDRTIIRITIDGGYEPETEYEISIAGGESGVVDVFGGFLADNKTIRFTTRAAAPMVDAAGIDAAEPDAGVDAADIDAGDVDADVDAS